ncbi:hypothetical protein FB45DRAFT_997123 [Roridomyces roridus]|uniref:F-box domain-containing protein n=1 Tax=Roridomyces roridus TaxID=1738132 RepID=A0AAD7CID8_9AGAR|nr:hypothetical protein FB45DRAFT_997123 [Roridomyces roridus]
MSSLRRFPNEMLSEIFLRCVDAAATFDPVHNAGWALARVCQRWRSVALTTPDLWSHFVFPGPSDFRRPIPHRLWEIQLDRAHNSSLSIRFVAHVPADLLDMFFTVADRWKEVAFANNKVFARFVDLAIEFPFLTKLVVEDDSFGPLLPSGVPGTDLVKRLPTLRHLTLALGSSNSFPPQLRFPWSQLRTCNLGNFRTSRIREVLPLLSPGTHLTLRAPGAGDGSPTMIVTNIQSLEIMDGSRAARRDLLNVLVAPRLQKLLFTQSKVEGTDPDAITTFLNNSKCTLRHFRILGCMWWQLINILRLPAVGGVVHLEIGYLPMGEWGRLFVELERVEPRLVPDLRTLVLRGNFSCWKISQRLSNRNPAGGFSRDLSILESGSSRRSN